MSSGLVAVQALFLIFFILLYLTFFNRFLRFGMNEVQYDQISQIEVGVRTDPEPIRPDGLE